MRNLIKYLLCGLLMVGGFMPQIQSIKADNSITVYYQRTDNKYAGWNLWAWEKGLEGKSYAFQEAAGVYSTKVTIKGSQLGFIVRLNEWEAKDIADDRFVDISGIKAIYLRQGDPAIYLDAKYTKPYGVKPTSGVQAKTLVINYYRFNGDYQGWNAWIWPKGGEGQAIPLTTKNDFGMSATIDISNYEVQEAGIIIRLNEWEAKDITDDRFIQLNNANADGVVEVFLVEGKAEIAYSKQAADTSVGIKSIKFEDFTHVGITFQGVVEASEIQGLKVYKNNQTVSIKKVVHNGNYVQLTLGEQALFTAAYQFQRGGSNQRYDINLYGLYDTKEFRDNYTYDGDDLGAIYQPTSTTIKLWAPTTQQVNILLYKDGTTSVNQRLAMKKSTKGTWAINLTGDYNGYYYVYELIRNNHKLMAVDPYAKAVNVNGTRAMIINMSKTNPIQWEDTKPVTVNKPNDAIIYELHVRDLSMDPNSMIDQKGKYAGLMESGTKYQGVTTGFDHIKEMGVTHVHLLPVFDYRSIDETSLDKHSFNWGYDPQHYNTPEGSYSSDPYHGEVRVRELKEVIKAYAKENIGIIMDVVYNHTGSSQDSDFNKIVPFYYYRLNDDGTLSNGSGCGNEVASERPMARKFIVDSVKYWVDEYKVSGFRFDLMGLLDIETMNAVRAAIGNELLIYGEGWTGGTSPLPESQKAIKSNVNNLNNIAVFSDEIRDGIKGHVFNAGEGGLLQGFSGLGESVKFGIVGGVQHDQINYSIVNYSKQAVTDHPSQLVVYVEAHDNLTLNDKLKRTMFQLDEAQQIALQQLAGGIVLTSQGIPFIHAGQEFLRSKDGNDNSYNAPDIINALKWEQKVKFRKTVEYYQGLIQLRKAHPSFRLNNGDEVRSNIDFFNTPIGTIGYEINNQNDTWQKIIVLINPTTTTQTFNVETNGHWQVVVNEKFAGVKVLSTQDGNKLKVAPQSMIVAYQDGYSLSWLVYGLLLGTAIVVLVLWLRKRHMSKKLS
jgi:pullulanase